MESSILIYMMRSESDKQWKDDDILVEVTPHIYT